MDDLKFDGLCNPRRRRNYIQYDYKSSWSTLKLCNVMNIRKDMFTLNLPETYYMYMYMWQGYGKHVFFNTWLCKYVFFLHHCDQVLI